MRILGEGFINTALPDLERTVPGADRTQFDLLVDLCRYAETLKHELDIERQETPDEKQRVVAVIVLLRMLEIVQSAVILSAYGVREELNSLFRIFLDAYFVLANCCTSAEFVPTYFRSDLPARLKLLNSAEKHDSEIFTLVNDYATAQVKDDLEAKIRAERIDAFNSYVYARNIKCEHLYDSMYRLMSASIHTTPRSLEGHIETNESGEIVAMHHGPDHEVTDQRLHDFAWFLIQALRGVVELFGGSQAAQLNHFQARLKVHAPVEQNGNTRDDWSDGVLKAKPGRRQ